MCSEDNQIINICLKKNSIVLKEEFWINCYL